MIIIADYGVGNLLSVERMARKAGADCRLASDPDSIRNADKVILPGVGNFGHCAEMLRASPMFDALTRHALEDRKPILGICVGGQLLGHSSEEAEGVAGLGWVDMVCKRFPDKPGYRVPHVAWNTIELARPSPLFPALDEDSRYYFVHSYYMDCRDPGLTVATVAYSVTYACAVTRDNIYGVQFHPEKSLRHGLALMRAFAAL